MEMSSFENRPGGAKLMYTDYRRRARHRWHSVDTVFAAYTMYSMDTTCVRFDCSRCYLLLGVFYVRVLGIIFSSQTNGSQQPPLVCFDARSTPPLPSPSRVRAHARNCTGRGDCTMDSLSEQGELIRLLLLYHASD